MDQNKFRLLNIFSLILVVILFVCFCMILLINPSFKIAMLCYLSEFEIGLFYFPKSHVPNPGGHNFILILTQSLHLGNQDRKACPKVMFFNLFSNLHVAHGPGCLRSVEVTGSPAPLVWLLWAASGCCHWSVEVLETKETSCNCRFSGLDVHRKQCQKNRVRVVSGETGWPAQGWSRTLRRRGRGSAGVLCEGAQALGCIDLRTILALPLGARQLISLNLLPPVKWAHHTLLMVVEWITWADVMASAWNGVGINRIMAVVVIMVPVRCLDTVR